MIDASQFFSNVTFLGEKNGLKDITTNFRFLARSYMDRVSRALIILVTAVYQI